MAGTISKRELTEGCDAIGATLRMDDELGSVAEAVADADRVYLLGCGSSYWAAMMAGYRLRVAGVDATAVHAAEFLLSPHPVDADAAVFGFSQSGETEETVRALTAAAEAGATAIAVTNTPDSRLDRCAAQSFRTPAGEQEALLATKTVDAAVAMAYGVERLLDGDAAERDPESTVERCRATLDVDLAAAVGVLEDADCTYALGTGTEFGLAGEAATKLGEAALLHTTPQPALEIAHGHVANVDGDAVVLLATDPPEGRAYANLLSLLDDAGARTIAVCSPDTTFTADVVVELPIAPGTVLPPLKLVQRLARRVSLERGYDPDEPPGLPEYSAREIL